MIGLVVGATTGKVYAVINPDRDEELDNPRWLLIKLEEAGREPIALLRVDLGEYMACTHPDQVQAIADRRFVRETPLEAPKEAPKAKDKSK